MIVRMGLFRRKDGLSEEQFLDHWRTQHGPVARGALAELKAYVQNAVTDRMQKGIDYDRLPIEVDGMSQLYFEDLGALRRSTDPDAIKALADDEAHFMQDLIVVTAIQNVVIPPPPAGTKMVKRMSLLRKLPGISSTEFQDQWWNMHPVLVKRIPGVLGYRQNLVIETRKDRFDSRDNASDLQIDGIVELWFESPETIESGFRSPAGITTMTHAKEFLAQISTYVVEPYDVFAAMDA